MRHMTFRERQYRRTRLNCVRHITLDPKGPGVVRIHMIPPRDEMPDAPFLLLLNGARLVPLNLSWAILLSALMDQLLVYEGQELDESRWEALMSAAVEQAHRVYPRTRRLTLAADLHRMLTSLIAIAQGREPEEEVGLLTLGEYAPEMTAPHRMDLMVSAMEQDGAWHCNQKCLHCYAAGQLMGETPELSTEAWKTVLDTLRKAHIPQVTFTGGEPTLRRDLVELVGAAEWFVTRLNTNGRLLTPELCAGLYEASLDSVQVTLYSAEGNIHNQLVGVNGFCDTVQGIRNAVAAGLIPSGSACGQESRATALTPEQLTDILRQAVDTAEELGMELDFTSPGWLDEETLRGLGLSLIPSCGACLSNMAVTPDGKVVPCQSWLSDEPLGDLLHDDWADIWNSPRCAAIRAESAKLEHLCQLKGKEAVK